MNLFATKLVYLWQICNLKIMNKKLEATARLLEVMDTLREQCPWDREQTFLSLRKNTIEETFELADAITDGNMEGIKEELGDVLLHVVFYSKMADEQGEFDYADVCIEDFNPVGDAVVNVPGLDTPIAPVSNIIDFYIAHLLEIECVKQCIDRGLTPPVWSSANTPGGDEKNAAYLEKYKPRVKML